MPSGAALITGTSRLFVRTAHASRASSPENRNTSPVARSSDSQTFIRPSLAYSTARTHPRLTMLSPIRMNWAMPPS